MTRIHGLGILVAAGVLAACGSSGSDKTLEATKAGAESAAATPTPAFSHAAWNQEWSSAKRSYILALQGFNNQMNLLDRSAATDQQYAIVITTNSRTIADAAAALVKQLDEAGPIPAERGGLQKAVDDLRAALVNEEKAYRVSAGCRRDLECLVAARPAVIEAAKRSGDALGAMPSR